MPRPPHLPESLAGRPFSSGQAARMGVPYGRLRRQDLTTPSRGVRVPRDTDPPVDRLVSVLQEVSAACAASHATAARLWGMRVPATVLADASVHLTTPLGHGQLRRRGVVGHRQKLRRSEVVDRHGVRLTSPARTWLDLAPQLSVTELVVAGDELVCAHRHGLRAGVPPKCTVADLVSVIAAHPGARGVVGARAAVERIRVGADSGPETLLRLVLEDAGLSGLVLDLALRAPDGFPEVQPDIAVPEHSLSVQFEGAHHDSAGQRVRDIERQRRTEAHGWTEVRVTWADLHTVVAGPQGPEPRAVALVRRAIEDNRRRRVHG